MAKKKIATPEELAQSEAQAFGLSTETYNENKEKVAARMKELYNTGAKNIVLSIANEEVDFELVTIPVTDILTKTLVLEDNERDQSYVNRLSVIELTNEIKQFGQTYPAIGQIDDNGRIEIVDGSQRRYGCYYAGCDFKVFVASKRFSKPTAKNASSTANTHKELSLIERGKKWKELLDTEVYKDQKSLSLELEVNPAIVNAGIKAASIPDQVIALFPSPTDLGKSSFNSLKTLMDELDERTLTIKVENFKAKYGSEIDELVAAAKTPNDVTTANMKTLNLFSEFVKNSKKVTAPKVATRLNDGSTGKASLKNKKLKVEIKGTSDELLKDLSDVLARYGLTIE